MVFGFIFAYIFLYLAENQNRAFSFPSEWDGQPDNYNRHLQSDDIRDENIIKNLVQSMNKTQHRGEDIVANFLKEEVRILCWVKTYPENHKTKAVSVKATWGKRCNTVLFMSSAEDEELPTIALPVGEGRDKLWGKTKAAFEHVYHHYHGTYDWVMATDDDTFVIVENLRYMLRSHNPSEPVYFGCKFKPYVEQGYMSGGAGYVLSQEAVKRLIVDGLEKNKCRTDDGGYEDVEIGLCLAEVGVAAGDSRDDLGRGRFFPLTPSDHLNLNSDSLPGWYWEYIYYPNEKGPNGLSDTAISFHYVTPENMYVFYNFLYHLRPYGVNQINYLSSESPTE